MPKVKFLESRTVQAADGETYTKGEVHDLPPDSCHHWVRRGVAVFVPDAVNKVSPPKPKPKSKPKDDDGDE